jgi:valyl-tRNA synthetase
MPFITEELYQSLYKDADSIMISKWPEYDEACNFEDDEKDMETVISAIRAIRNIRLEMNVPVSKKANIIFAAKDRAAEVIKKSEALFVKMASASSITVQADKDGIPEDAAAAVVDGAEIYIPLDELIDFEKEIDRLAKEKENLQKELDRVNGKLNNEKFISKAPQKVVDEEKEKLIKYQQMFDNVTDRLDNLRKRFGV